MELFGEFCELPGDVRDERLAALGADEPEIAREVRALLEAERDASRRLSPSLFAAELADVELLPAGRSLTGSSIAHFEVGDRLGRGGMGEVYSGVDTVLCRDVALKVIRSEHRMSESARRRFLREAQMLSSLDHPNICRIHDYLRGDEADVLVLELVRGHDLRHAVEEGLSSGDALSIAEQVADALTAAHAEGIVHRDLKPSNIMLTAEGTVKILDFGLARPVEEDRSEDHADEREALEKAATAAGDPDRSIQFRTAAGMMAGTPSAMSPEQIEGRPATAASDMYSFGLLAHELFTGQSAYGPDLSLDQLLAAARTGTTQPATGIDRHVTDLVEELKAPGARQRPTAAAALARLRWIRDKPKRRLRRIAVAVLVAVFALGGLKYTLDLRRERTVADQRRSQAEDLIGFMVGDLRAKLEPVGRLDVLDDVGDRALEYFASVAEGELSDGELLGRSLALTQIGEVRLSQNRYDEALASFEEAYRHSAALAARKPREGDVLFDRGQAEYWVGYVHWRRLQRSRAQEWLSRYRDTSEELLERDPERADWILEAAYAHHNLAVLDLESSNLEQADRGFNQEVRVLESLIERSPDDLSLVEDLADAYTWLGTTARRRGELEQAHAYFTQSTMRRRALVEALPDHATWRFWWAQSAVMEGEIAVIRGLRAEGVEIYRGAIDVLEGMVAADTTNREWLRILATAQVAQAKALAADHGPGQVRRQLSAATAALEGLVGDDAGDRLARRAYGSALRLAARLEHLEGDPARALDTAARAVATAERLHGDASDDPELIGDLASSLVLLGELEFETAEEAAARDAWRSARELLSRPVEGSGYAGLLDPWARVAIHEGRLHDFDATVAALSASGYEPIWRWPDRGVS